MWVSSYKVALDYTRNFSYVAFLAGSLSIIISSGYLWFVLEKHLLTQRIASHMGGFSFWDKLNTAISVSSTSMTVMLRTASLRDLCFCLGQSNVVTPVK